MLTNERRATWSSVVTDFNGISHFVFCMKCKFPEMAEITVKSVMAFFEIKINTVRCIEFVKVLYDFNQSMCHAPIRITRWHFICVLRAFLPYNPLR
jgi:hypothetical protein